MIFAQVRSIYSTDLTPPELPPDPLDAEVSFFVTIGDIDGEDEQTFRFTVITPVRLARTPDARWGRGILLLAGFDWQAVIQSVAQLIASSSRDTWPEVVAELDKTLIAVTEVEN